jgi:DNA polymerase III epsilon subunit-like protein
MKKLFLDIETAPNLVYVWGLWNQNVGINQIVEPGYTLCWAAQWEGEKTLHFRSIVGGEQQMLEGIHQLLEEADAVVHYNGRRFDMPMLNKEFIKHGLEPPAPYHQIDLLETARRRFRFESNKLDYVAQFLGVGTKLQHKGMELWRDCMDGDAKAWKEMERYNKQDVRLLPQVYQKLLPWISDHPNAALYSDDTRPVCTNCGSHNVVKKGVEKLKTLSYQRYKCNDCGTPLRGRSTILDIEKRKNILTQSKL